MKRTLTYQVGKVYTMVSRGIPTAETEARSSDSGACVDRESLLNECVQDADEIIGLLEEESGALVSFNSALLMQLLPRKEHLFNAFKERITGLPEGSHPASGVAQDSARASLREQLHRIQRLNETNRAFIENTLSHYQDFMNCLCPASYGRGQEGRPERSQVAMRGVAFKKEI